MEHYILKGVTDALFLDIRNLGTSEYAIKNNAGVTPRGVVYTLRSVREARVVSTHTLRVSIYSNVGVSLSVHSYGFPKTSNIEQAEVKHPRFLYVAINRLKNHLTLGCLSEQIE